MASYKSARLSAHPRLVALPFFGREIAITRIGHLFDFVTVVAVTALACSDEFDLRFSPRHVGHDTPPDGATNRPMQQSALFPVVECSPRTAVYVVSGFL